MTFGEIKTLFEDYLIFSYKKKKLFKESVSDFRKNILSDKNLVKLFSLYSDLSTPQGLSESDANQYLNDGIENIKELISKSNLPKEKIQNITNNYKDIDNLVYPTGKNNSLKERLESRKNIIKILTEQESKINNTTLNIPISSMVNVANKTIQKYFETLDESSKKELIPILTEDIEVVKNKFESLKSDTVKKLISAKNQENDRKIDETIEKIKQDKFDYLTYYKLKKLNESI